MESSRSSLLSTLLMTLPLIVVPAIALLRPPGQSAGISTSALDADENPADSFMDEFEDLGRPSSNSGKQTKTRDSVSDDAEFDGLFEEDSDVDSRPQTPRGRKSQPHSGSVEHPDPFNPFDEPLNEPARETPEVHEEPETHSAEKIVEQLNMQGALRTMWFEAGAKSPVGLAVFFRGQTDLVRIRFEAVGQTREDCAKSVLNQVTEWKAEQVRAEQAN
jgi:hypothetical protein